VTGFVLQVVSSGGVPGRGLRRSGARPPERIDCPTLPALHRAKLLMHASHWRTFVLSLRMMGVESEVAVVAVDVVVLRWAIL
jgi:hypothetical protein